MAKDQAATNSENDATSWQKSSLGNYNSDMAGYTSNVNSALAGGNPYQSQPYLQNQNLQTSGAMDSADTKAAADTRDVALRTGTNTAAVAAEKAETARAGQRDLTNYTAGQTNQNEDKWLQERQQLYGDQLAGANSEAGIYGTATGERNDAVNNETQIDQSEMGLWQAGIGAVGAAGAGAATKI